MNSGFSFYHPDGFSPLSLPSQGSWRGPGVGSEAFYFKMFTSMRLNGNMKPRSFSS